MDRVTRVSTVGMDVLSVLYGDFSARTLGLEQVTFLVDRDRVERCRDTMVYYNGREWKFAVCPGDEVSPGESAQLPIFAMKATVPEVSIPTVRNQAGRDTVTLSVFDGTTSEAVIGNILRVEHMLYYVTQGMDAVKMENEPAYSHMGQIYIEILQREPRKEAMLEAVTGLFGRARLPHTREPDILRRPWCKWILDVGVNQAVMMEEGIYGTIQRPGPAKQTVKAVMAEIVELAGKEGIRMTMEGLNVYVDLIDSLNPDGVPSMRQDGLARRSSEVEFFADTVIYRTEAAGLDAPMNRELHRRIRGMERR